jgi:hypothetical protein
MVAWVEEAARKEGTLVELERTAGRRLPPEIAASLVIGA